jgi:hypothetical protein
MESLKRMREPAAFIVLAVLWLQLLINLVEFFLYGRQLHGSSAKAALVISAQMPQTITVLLLGLLVASCVLADRTKHARLLVLLALISSVVTILAALTLGVMGLVAESVTKVLDMVELLLLPIVVGVLVIFALVRLLPISATQGARPELPAVSGASPGEAVPPALPSPEQEPVWQPDAASGVAWYSAGDAAVGAPAAGWGTPGESGGWYPVPEQPEAPETPRSSDES